MRCLRDPFDPGLSFIRRKLCYLGTRYTSQVADAPYILSFEQFCGPFVEMIFVGPHCSRSVFNGSRQAARYAGNPVAARLTSSRIPVTPA
jgi:hypothetical protein